MKDFKSTESGIAAGQSVKEKEYWLEKLSGEWTKSHFYYDHSKPVDRDYQPETVTFTLTGELFSRLMKIISGSDAKLHMVLAAQLVLLLGKFIGSNDIIVGSPIYRQKVEGEFINTVLPLRTRLTGGDITFKDLLLRVRQTVNEAVKNQNYPMDKLIYQLDLSASDGRFPLFDVALLLENIHDRRYIAHIPCSMTFTFLRTPDAVEGTVEYDSLLYDRTSVERIVAHFSHLLEKTLFNVDIPLSAVDGFSDQEKKQLLVDFNRTDTVYPSEKTLHQCFEEQVRKTPDNVAVIGTTHRAFGQKVQHISYKELDWAAHCMACVLQDRGVKAGTIVGIMAEPSMEMMAAIFAVLKAGGAYLPIDPNYPEDRINYMLKDSGAKVLLKSEIRNPKSETNSNVQNINDQNKNLGTTLVLNFENLNFDIVSDFEFRASNLSFSNLAYVIYTSGSTGRPKGVLIEHRNIMNYVWWRIHAYKQVSSDICLQLVSFSFDGFCANSYPGLLSGGAMVYLDERRWRDTDMIRRVVREQGVTHFSVVPSMYRVLLDGASASDFKSLRFVVLAGEKADADLIRSSKKLFPHVELINEYGPTENAVTTTCCRDMTSASAAVIGVPIANNRIFILDDHDQLKPVGVPGELCISGAGLARGYLNRPELTAEKFNRFYRSYRSYILYKTGDLARWLPDGPLAGGTYSLEILGRTDNQVQIRGFRVELDEIEAHLLACPDVKEAAVIVKEASGYNYLCAYIVARSMEHGAWKDMTELRESLAKELPDYMVPTYLIAIQQMPLTPNGKIDRKALTDLEISTTAETEYLAPRSETQKKLVEIWQKFLEREQVGIRDNFFNIGGDSIKTIGLLSLVNKAFNTDFELVDLYENDTIEKLAEKIDTHEKTAAHNRFKEIAKEVETLKERVMEQGEGIFPGDREIEDIYPMSDIEKGMIFYSLRDTVPTVYYNQVVYQLEHPAFDEGIFKKAFERLVKKHSILRSGFNMGDFEEPVQIVFKQIPLDKVILHEDISHLDRTQQEAYINAFLEKDRGQPFDMKRPESLWRVKTFLIDNDNIIFIWIGHHALIDGWSSASLVTELNNIYLALKTNPDFIPGTLKASYKDFIIEQLAVKKNNEIMEFWKRELMDYKRLEFPGPSGYKKKSRKIKTCTENLGAQLLDALTAAAGKYKTSVKNVCFGAYLYMLHMLSYENDIVAGLVANSRPNCEDGDKIIGCFLNTVPVRLKIPAQISCANYIQRVEQKMLELKRYEKMPFFEIVRAVEGETGEQNPLFDTLFNFVDFHVYHQLHQPGGKESAGSKKGRSSQLVIEGSGSINTLFNFDVNITMGYFLISLSYSNALIDDELALNCPGFFETFLKRFVHEPEHVLEKETLIPEEEKQRLLIDFNSSAAAYPHDKTLHELFAVQAEKNPDHIALIGPICPMGLIPAKTFFCALSYRELAERSGYLAYLLKEKGVQPGTVVGIKVERSLEMVIGILGILKAGGAYLPIDPDCPEERMNYMLADSNTRTLLSAKDIEPSGGYRSYRSYRSYLPGKADNLAYIIYTSGTTGRPKGVLVEHRNAVNTVSWFGREYGVRPGVRLLMMSDYTFDASVNQVFGTLLHGAELHIIHPERLSDIHGLRQLIEQRGIHIINFVPTFLTELLAGKDKLKSLQVVISGAEPLGEAFKEEMLGRGYTLYNHYGPTETTIDALSCQCTNDTVTLGKPISNVHCFILDNQQALLPVGVAGELFIAGPGVARGYLNRPELTAEKFNRSYKPYRTYILYRTGDLARWLPNGNIEFLGRIDRQVKIRGYRIELEEIENKLLDHEQIKEAVVLARESQGGERCLCAYIVPHSPHSPHSPHFQEYLMQRLPGYMIPSHFIHLDAFPLTPNGKVDRQALPGPGTGTGQSQAVYIAPRNEIEETLVSIWSEVLNSETQPPIGISDNFFHLGGHSLKAMVMVSQVRKIFNVELPLSRLFHNPTIKGLYEFIAHAAKRIYEEIKPVEKKEYYPLSSAQKRLYFLQQMDPGNIGYNMPRIIPAGKDIHKEKLERTLQKLIARHESLRTSFEMAQDVPVQKVHDHAAFKIEYSDIKNGPDPIPNVTHFIDNFIRPFDLSQVPLIRSGMVKLPDNNHIWVVDMHHIVSDGTSMSVLIEDFQAIYPGGDLPGLELHYKDFSQWQNRLFETGGINAQEVYWLKLYVDAGDIPRLPLPADFKRPEVFTFAGEHVDFMLGREETAGFKALGSRYNCTLYINTLAALNTLFYKYTGQTDIIIGTGIAGRPHADLQRIIGMFVNTLAMRNHPRGEKTYEDFLEEVAANSIRAFENQDVQFEELVDKLDVARDPSRNPLFDISMAVQNFRRAQAGMDVFPVGEDLSAFTSGYKSRTARFDMTFFITEYGDDIDIGIEYYTGIFKQDTIQRLAGHFKNVVRAVSLEPGICLKNIEIITPEEKRQVLFEFNNTAREFPGDTTIHEQFEKQAAKTPHAVALVHEKSMITYRELDDRADRLGRYLYNEKGIKPGDRVGIWLSKSLNRVAAVMGILKAGACYVPLDPALPVERLRYMIADARIGVILSEKRYIRDLDRLQWECDCFHTYLCMDSYDIYSEEETQRNELMDEELWHHVAESADDDITGGGWISSYTGQPFSREEMDEYGDNILTKLDPLLHPKMRVLEIGCASGISMYRIAPRVGLYYGTDLSTAIIEWNKKKVGQEGHRNIILSGTAAHEIHRLEENQFDLVIMNSVIQCFHGHNYLRQVIGKAIDLLGTGGYLFIGDVMDQDRKDALVKEMTAFKYAHGDMGYNTKTDFSSELFVSRGFWRDLGNRLLEVREIQFSQKLYTIENELNKFRYDVLVKVDKKGPARGLPGGLKYQEDLRVLPSRGGSPLHLDIAPDNPAYIIYTSGTTGMPGGVVVEHRSLVNLCYWHNRQYSVTGADHATLYAGFGFDASVWELFPYLLEGAALHIVTDAVKLDTDMLNRYFHRHDITVAFLPTQLCEQFMLSEQGNRSLRVLLTGGDKLRTFTPGSYRLYNNYGPTENTVVTTSYLVASASDNIPVGKPVDNCRVYILDKETLWPQPPGVAGELCIAGAGLARGYLNNPELTAQRFRNNRSYTLYRTGDLARWLPDSPAARGAYNIEFLGRIDHQVKIRGYRIELGEIENRLLAHGAVKEAVVTARDDQRGNTYLCAYIVPAAPGPLPDLKKYLSTLLPGYMLPSHFTQLERIPLTPNGKIDRKALPVPGIKAGEAYIAPGSAKEDKLAKIWSEVLGIEKEAIGVDDDFFKLGGHSLNATIMVSKVHKELDVKLPLGEVFRSPTIKGLAGYIKNADEEIYTSIQPVEKKEYYPLSSAQERMFLVNQLKGDNLSDNTPGVMRVEGPLDKKRFEHVIGRLIKRHESFRTSFEILGEVPVQRVYDHVDIEIEYNECSPPGVEDSVREFIRPFDLGKAPLLRVGLLKLSHREHILMYDIHHIINDALSSGIFINEFINLYEGVTLPPLKIQYRDFAVWQNGMARSDALVKQEAYWLNVFSGEIPVPNMPIDFPVPAVQSFEGDLIEFRFDKELSRALNGIAEETGATFYMMILAIYNILLSRYCGGEDFVVGTPAAGRPHADLENVVGMFVNTLAIRNYPKAEKTFTEFLRDVKTNTLEAFENQDYQFEELIKKLGIKPDSGRHPLFNTMFAAVLDVNVNLGVEGAVKRIKDLTFYPYPFDEKITQFDIIFHAFDMEEGITFRLKYCTKLFKRETIENFAGYFEEIASVVVNNKTVKLKDIQLSHDLVESTSAFSKENESHFEF